MPETDAVKIVRLNARVASQREEIRHLNEVVRLLKKQLANKEDGER